MEKDKKANGLTLLLIAVILLLIIGGAYIIKSKPENPPEGQQIFAPITVEDEKEVESILKDLRTTETETEIDIENLE